METQPMPQDYTMITYGHDITADLMEAFSGHLDDNDALFILLEYDLITTDEVDEVVEAYGRNHWPALKLLFRRAHIDAIARGLVPGRLN
jgi:hypothetical protein